MVLLCGLHYACILRSMQGRCTSLISTWLRFYVHVKGPDQAHEPSNLNQSAGFYFMQSKPHCWPASTLEVYRLS